MPKRSLNSKNGETKKIEQLNQAVEKMLARNDGRVTKAGAEIEPLVRIAADLRNLPSASFKARLKSELGGKKRMSTVAEPVTANRTFASPNLVFKDAAKAIEFYEKAFGAKETFRFEAGGSIPHAEITIGDSLIILSDEWPEGGRFGAETLGSSPCQHCHPRQRCGCVRGTRGRSRGGSHPSAENQFYGHRDVTSAIPLDTTGPPSPWSRRCRWKKCTGAWKE